MTRDDVASAEARAPAPPRRAFELFAEDLATWWPSEFTWSQRGLEWIGIDSRGGGLCPELGPGGLRIDWGRVLVWHPPDRLAFTWQIGPSRVPEPEPDTSSARFDVQPSRCDGAVDVNTSRSSNTGGLMTRIFQIAALARATLGAHAVAAEARQVQLVVSRPHSGATTRASTVVVRGRVTAGSHVAVKGHELRVRGRTFRARVRLRPGRNPIPVVARGACLDPNSPDYDCAGGGGDGPDCTGPVRVVGDDHFRLDADGDREACE